MVLDGLSIDFIDALGRCFRSTLSYGTTRIRSPRRIRPSLHIHFEASDFPSAACSVKGIMRLRAKVRRLTGATCHYSARLVEGEVVTDAALPPPAWVDVRSEGGVFYLLYF